METDIGYPLGWAFALLVAVIAAVRAMRESAREKAAQEQASRLAARRRDAALALLSAIRDAEVREAWPRVAAVLENGSLTDGTDVRALSEALAAGGGRQLAEEVTFEVPDESSERVALYHLGFEPPTLECPRDALGDALRRLADALDAGAAEA